MSKTELVRYTVGAITGGMDSLGEVSCRLKENGYVVPGRNSEQENLNPKRKRPQI